MYIDIEREWIMPASANQQIKSKRYIEVKEYEFTPIFTTLYQAQIHIFQTMKLLNTRS